MKVAFVTDTGTGLSPEQWQEEGIYCLPLQLECDGISYDEYVNIHQADVIEKLHEKKIFRTSLPKLGYIEDCFEQIKEQGYDTVFAVPICKGLSGCFDAMEMVARQLDLQFIGVDCYVTAVVQSQMIRKAKAMYEQGIDLDTIVESIQRIADSADTILMFRDLEHMKRGGRLTPAAATLAGLLKIVPICHINKETNGKVDTLAKVRTWKKAQEKVIDHVIEKGMDASYTFILAHVDCLDEAIAYKDKIEQRIENAHVKIIDLVTAVGIHTGLGCLALQVFKE
ncbi:DegV family protein [Floccifex sp.]|uniref:DegV family protein n=1 Tax=Floccifex sp. TaxID=2815810 RepID=UPI003F02743F